jgi:phosphomannomutase
VLEVTDYQTGLRTRATGATSPTGLPPSDVLSFALEGGSRVMLRPSGTEPKIKYYFDLRVDVDPKLSMELSLAQARAHLAAFILAFREGCRTRGVVGG